MPMMFFPVSTPPNTANEIANAVIGSSAPMMLAGVLPMMCMERVMSNREITVGKTASPAAFAQDSMLASGVMSLPKLQNAKKITVPNANAKNDRRDMSIVLRTLLFTPMRYIAYVNPDITARNMPVMLMLPPVLLWSRRYMPNSATMMQRKVLRDIFSWKTSHDNRATNNGYVNSITDASPGSMYLKL